MGINYRNHVTFIVFFRGQNLSRSGQMGFGVSRCPEKRTNGIFKKEDKKGQKRTSYVLFPDSHRDTDIGVRDKFRSILSREFCHVKKFRRFAAYFLRFLLGQFCPFSGHLGFLVCPLFGTSGILVLSSFRDMESGHLGILKKKYVGDKIIVSGGTVCGGFGAPGNRHMIQGKITTFYH